MEYCEQDLATLLDSMKTPFSVSEVKCLLHQLLLGVQFCHDRFIIHRSALFSFFFSLFLLSFFLFFPFFLFSYSLPPCHNSDLKLSNLLLNGKGILKIADFGLARPFGIPFRPMTPKVVTLWYRAPELLFGSATYTTAIDSWSTGCIFGELLKHSPLLPGKHELDQLELINNLLGTPNEQIWPGFSQLRLARTFQLPRQPYNNLKLTFPQVTAPTIDLLNRFLTYHPAKRITIHDALDHPYFAEKPLAKDPEMMPTFPEIRNEEYEASRRKRQQVEEKKAAPKGDIFARDLNLPSFDSNVNFNSLFNSSKKRKL